LEKTTKTNKKKGSNIVSFHKIELNTIFLGADYRSSHTRTNSYMHMSRDYIHPITLVGCWFGWWVMAGADLL
jgi:hypothetical protein